MTRHTLVWLVLLLGTSSVPLLRAVPPEPDKDLKTLVNDLARLEREHETLSQELDKAVAAGRAVVEERKTLDLTDPVAVQKHNEKSQAASKRIKDAEAGLKENITKQWRLHDQIRLTELRARNRALTREIEDLDARVKRDQAFLKRLGEQSSTDVKELDAAAAEAQKGVLGSTVALVDQFVGVAGQVGELSGSLKKLESTLQRLSGDKKWKELLEAVTEMRETAEFFNSKETKQFIKRAEDVKAATGKIVKTVDDPESAKKLDEIASLLSAWGQWAVKECEGKTKVGTRLMAAVNKLPLKEVEQYVGLTTLRRLSSACTALAYGELAITGLATAGELMLAEREVKRLTDQVERRNALIKSFSPGGTHHKVYAHEVARLKAAREEKARNEAEIKEIEARLGK